MKRTLKVFAIVLAFFLLIAGSIGTVYYFWLRRVHPVVPHQLYRSAQLTPELFAKYVKANGIKSIINLRGAHPEQSWYQGEVRVSKALGVKHFNLKMHAIKLPTKQTLEQLITLLQTAPEPILVHCEGGADRSGLASAVFLLLHNQSLQAAWRQVSWEYFVVEPSSVGKHVLPMYHQWLAKEGFKHSTRAHFLTWVKQTKRLSSKVAGTKE